MVDDPRRFWVGFNLVKGIGPVRLKALLDAFGDAEHAWHAPADRLLAAGLSPKLVSRLQEVRAHTDLDALWQRIQAQHIRVLTWLDAEYPARLRDLDTAPPVLYLRGALDPADDWAVAVVGTRRATAYGRQVAEELARALAQNGITVVSGLARGVDAVAHRAALDAGGRTLAVLGSGVDVIYPPEHRRLAERIRQQGALISDYPPGTQPEAANFPPRNRIISGLSVAVVVVEAGKSSGALITARYAAEQGREVFAVPGNIYAPQSQGCNRLIQQGANALLSPRDLLEVLHWEHLGAQQAARRLLPADENEATLLRLLRQGACHVDDLTAATGWPAAQVAATLTMMELKGLVRSLGGMQYMAVREAGSSYEVEP